MHQCMIEFRKLRLWKTEDGMGINQTENLGENNFRGNKFRQVYLANTIADSRTWKIKKSLRLFPRLQISSGWLGWGFTLLSNKSKIISEEVKSLSQQALLWYFKPI